MENEISEEMVRKALKQVIDPELGIDIVELGLIYKIGIEDRGAGSGESKATGHQLGRTRIKILMTLTTPGCPLAGSFQFMVMDALRVLPNFNPEQDLNLFLTFDPPWVPDMMSEEAKISLNMQ